MALVAGDRLAAGWAGSTSPRGARASVIVSLVA
jgi:hypothetical protein